MQERTGGIDGRSGRPARADGRFPGWDRPRLDHRRLLAISFALLVVFSVLAVPVAVAQPADPGNKGGGGNQAGSSGGSGGDNQAGSSGGRGGGNQAGSSDARSGGSDAAGGSDTGANAGQSRGENGNSQAAGQSDGDNGNSATAGQSRGDNGNSATAGPPDDRGDGPAVSVATGRPAGPDDADRTAPGRSDQAPGRSAAEPPSVVQVAVAGAQRGDRVAVDTSPAEVEDDQVAFDGVSVTVKRGGAFTMTVTNSRDPLPGSPAFEPDDAAKALGRIRLEHSITNEEVEDVSFTFRVSKTRLREQGTDSEKVALYRFADGGWTELSTDVIGETETHYIFAADSPGLSEFAVGAKRPAFEVHSAEAGADRIAPGEALSVSARVTNVGGADGVYEATLVVDGKPVSTRRITIAAGGTRQVNFELTFDRPGTHEVAVDSGPVGEVEVVAGTADGGPPSVDQALSMGFDLVLEVGRSLRLSRLPTIPTG